MENKPKGYPIWWLGVCVAAAVLLGCTFGEDTEPRPSCSVTGGVKDCPVQGPIRQGDPAVVPGYFGR